MFIIVVLFRLLGHLEYFFKDDAFVLLLFLFLLCFAPLVQRVFFKTSPLQLHERFALTAFNAAAVMFWLMNYGKEIDESRPDADEGSNVVFVAAIVASALGWYLWLKWAKDDVAASIFGTNRPTKRTR